MKKMIGWTALGITCIVLLIIGLRIDDWGRDWKENSATLDRNARRPGLHPVTLDQSSESTIDQIRAWTEGNARWDFISSSNTEGATWSVKLTRTTPIFRFVDDINVTIRPSGDSGTIEVDASSRSRVGKGDLGQNPRNLIELTTALRANSPR